MIERLAIIGVGLIGGSLAMALKRAGVVGRVVGVGRTESNLRLAKERGIIDEYVSDVLSEAVTSADVIFLSVPVETIPLVLEKLQGRVKADCVITDGGSTKRIAAKAGDALFNQGGQGGAFIGGHPIAGTEKTGAGAAFAELYDGRRVILTPTAETPAWAIERATWMWRQAGAEVVSMGAEAHDRVLAGISHLPHAVAFALVNAVKDLEEKNAEPMLAMTAGGFRDFTRIASSDPDMWRDIFLQNGDQVLAALEAYRSQITELCRLIESEDGEGLAEYFLRAKTIRDELAEG